MDIGHAKEYIEAPLSLIAFFPLVGSLLAFLIGRTNKDYAGWIATLASATSFLFVVLFFSQLQGHMTLIDPVFNWMSVGGLSVEFKLMMDTLSATMCLVVSVAAMHLF